MNQETAGSPCSETQIFRLESRIFSQRTPGVEFSLLRTHQNGGLTFLVRMQQGARAERHLHPGGEETLVLSGRLRIDRRVNQGQTAEPDLVLGPGDYLFVPPGEVHEGQAEQETLFLVVVPGGFVRADSSETNTSPI